ncbi:MAG: DnaD domain-containing protein [Chloroflexota bacterium]
MNESERFEGFASRVDRTPIPNPFFSAILPEIDDLSELKVTLYIFWALYRKKGYPRFLTYSELRGDQGLMAGMKGEDYPEEQLRRGLDLAVNRGTLLHLKLEQDRSQEDLYFLNTEQDQRAVAKIQRGEIELAGMPQVEPAPTEKKTDIFSLYEEHIGLLSPMIVEDLKEAEGLYPASWIEDAFHEAARANSRSWRYVSKILERWAAQGKEDGTAREYTKKELEPEEYLRKYGRFARRR